MSRSDDQRGGASGERDATSEEQKAVTYLKRALVDLNEARRRLQESESRFTEPIAIVGMGCRYPGGVQSPEDLWELVAAGRDAISGLPEDRGWDLDMLRSFDREASSLGGGFIDGACDFDAEFFGIDDVEARMMDPQQRLLLETAWEACEYAGIDPGGLKGSDTGVFVGVGAMNYGLWLMGAVRESAQGHYSLGNTSCMIAGRLAYVLGVQGPGVTVDTACSSSSTALHLACQSLRQRESSLALAGGAAVIASPWMYYEFDRQNNIALAQDGRCRCFADGADGTGFSDGVGVVVLERLSDAQRLGHEVLAVVRGSACNQDGASNGLTAPNGLSHEKVIRQALSNAGISAGQVDAVEAHGMGSVLVDPIEAQALIASYGGDHSPDRPLWIGSLKSNVGHTQSAGGVGGVIKMVMAMRHGLLPRTLHVDAPSRFVDWSTGAVSLLTEPVQWDTEGDRRRAGVHSFGMSGTNVHIILEQPPPAEPAPSASGRRTSRGGPSEVPVPWPISGRGEEGLRRQAQRLLEFLAARPELDIADVGVSLAARPNMSHRAFVLGTGREQLLRAVEEVASGRWSVEVSMGIEESGPAGALASLGQSWVAGATVDWAPAFAGLDARPIRLPTYAFDRRRCWIDRSPVWASDGPMARLRESRSDGASSAALSPSPAAVHQNGVS